MACSSANGNSSATASMPEQELMLESQLVEHQLRIDLSIS